MRPRCSRIFGSTTSVRCALKRSCVPSSSAPIRREYPTTSAARIAARRRVAVVVAIARAALTLAPNLTYFRRERDLLRPRCGGGGDHGEPAMSVTLPARPPYADRRKKWLHVALGSLAPPNSKPSSRQCWKSPCHPTTCAPRQVRCHHGPNRR